MPLFSIAQLCFTAYPQNQTSQYSLKIRIHYHSSGNKHIHILVLWRRILACQKFYVSPDGGGGNIFLYLIKSFYQSTRSVSEWVCLCVCVFGCSLTPPDSWTDLAKLFFGLLCLGHRMVLGKKNQDPVFPGSRKNLNFRVIFDQFGRKITKCVVAKPLFR